MLFEQVHENLKISLPVVLKGSNTDSKHLLTHSQVELPQCNWVAIETYDATDGNLQPVTSPAPLYLLDDYAKVSIKEVQDSIWFFCI